MSTTFKTNRHWRAFSYRQDVPASVLVDQFEYLDDHTLDGFFQYRGAWYHLADFIRPSAPLANAPFRVDGYLTDSYSSGVIIQVSDDCEQYRIATWYS